MVKKTNIRSKNISNFEWSIQLFWIPFCFWFGFIIITLRLTINTTLHQLRLFIYIIILVQSKYWNLFLLVFSWKRGVITIVLYLFKSFVLYYTGLRSLSVYIWTIWKILNTVISSYRFTFRNLTCFINICRLIYHCSFLIFNKIILINW